VLSIRDFDQSRLWTDAGARDEKVRALGDWEGGFSLVHIELRRTRGKKRTPGKNVNGRKSEKMHSSAEGASRKGGERTRGCRARPSKINGMGKIRVFFVACHLGNGRMKGKRRFKKLDVSPSKGNWEGDVEEKQYICRKLPKKKRKRVPVRSGSFCPSGVPHKARNGKRKRVSEGEKKKVSKTYVVRESAPPVCQAGAQETGKGKKKDGLLL